MADDASAAWYCADAEQQIFGPLSVAQLAGSERARSALKYAQAGPAADVQ